MKFEVYYKKVGDRKTYMTIIECNTPDEGFVKLQAMKVVPDGATITHVIPVKLRTKERMIVELEHLRDAPIFDG